MVKVFPKKVKFLIAQLNLALSKRAVLGSNITEIRLPKAEIPRKNISRAILTLWRNLNKKSNQHQLNN